MTLPDHKTKIVCTIGPASSTEPVLAEMIRNGMDVARLNLSHGSFTEHRENIRRIRSAATDAGRSVTILIDLPGPKIRIGELSAEPLLLTKGERVTLTADPASAGGARIPVDFRRFPEMVTKGSIIYLNDGFLQLLVEEVTGSDVICTVVIGGHLLSRKGLNLVGTFPSIDAVTDRDLECIAFGLSEGLDIFSISFVARAEDIRKARAYAADLGKEIRVVAKIERGEALQKLDEILAAADGVMIARGDLGVQ
ncbi:MAG: pyruvate kinase, partial [Methanobacteriota archaeon]